MQKLSCLAAHGILVPGPGTQPVSPTLAGRFLTTLDQESPSQPHFKQAQTGLSKATQLEGDQSPGVNYTPTPLNLHFNFSFQTYILPYVSIAHLPVGHECQQVTTATWRPSRGDR